MENGVDKFTKSALTLPQKIWAVGGIAIAITLSLIIANYFSSVFGLPDSVIEGAYLFIGLPFLVIFFLGIASNDENFSLRNKFGKWGVPIFMIVALGIFFFWFGTMDSVTTNLRLLFQFFVGVLLVFFTAIVYLMMISLTKKKSYRTRSIISFSVSTLLTLLFIFLFRLLLKSIGIISWLG